MIIGISTGYNIRPEGLKLTKEAVWGKFDENYEMVDCGMVIGRSDQKCPVFGDMIPYKSVTIMCTKDQEAEVLYWIDYVQGVNAISARMEIGANQVALRANYMAW